MTLAALGVVGACSDPEAASPPFTRLPCTPEVSTWSGEDRLVARLEPTENPGAWKTHSDGVEPPNPVLVQMEADEKALVVAGRGARARSLAILRQPIDASQFNQIQLQHVVDGETSVRITLRGPDLEDWTSLRSPLQGDTDLRRTTIPIPRSVQEGGMRNELRIIYSGGQRSIGLMAVEYINQPVEGLLPDPSEGSAMIRIDDEWHAGFGLTPGHSLETTFDFTPGARLSFSVGELGESFDPDREVALNVTLSGIDQTLERTIPVSGAGQEPGWKLQTIAPMELERGPITARFEVTTGGDPFVACAISEPILSYAAPTRPPILLVTSDTHRGDYLGAAGDGDFIATPALDRMAAEGVYFDRCFVLSNVTNPSHSCLLTGLDPTRTRISTNNQSVSDSAYTLAEAFRASGYTTWAALGVRHLMGDVSGLGQGFDRMGGPTVKDRAAPETIDLALQWLSEEPDAPVFLWVHFYDAHWPYEPEPEFEELYSDEVDPSAPQFEWDHKLQHTRGDIENLDVPRARYKAEVTYLDSQLSRILEHEFFAEGIVALVGDHGEALGEHDIYFTHAELYPDVLHVPLLLRWPQAPAGTRIPGIASQIDLGRTLLDLAGLEEAAFPGKGLLRHIEVGNAGEDTHFALAGSNACASVTRDDMHLILHLKPHRSPYSVIRKEPHVVELYDLAADPQCLEDLVDERPELTAELRALAVRWLENADPDGLVGAGVHDPELERQLAELGYVDLADAVTEPLWTPDDCDWCTRFD